MKRNLIVCLIMLMGLVFAQTVVAEPHHTSMGVVGPKSNSNILVMYRVDLLSVPAHLFKITEKTEIWGADGKRIAFADLREGDYIKEECLRRPDGSFEVVKITVLTTASEG